MKQEIIITVLILVTFYYYYQNRKFQQLPTNSKASHQTIFELGENSEELIAARDQAIRSKNETEQELLAITNRLKNKQLEVSRKDTEINRLKQEKSQVEIALNKKITELKTDQKQKEKTIIGLNNSYEKLDKKYSKQSQLLDTEQCENNKLTEEKEKLTKQIQELEQARAQVLSEIKEGEEFTTELQQKVTDLENQLLNLAQQKIKGKKEATALVKELENNWQTEKKELEEKVASLKEEITKITQLNLELELANKKSYATEQEIEKTMDSILKSMQELNKDLDK
jgi:chromosome segregation ATPase